MKQVLLLSILLIMSSVVAASEITQADTEIVLEDTTAQLDAYYILDATEEIGNLTLILTPKSKDVQIHINGKKKDCLLQAEFARCGKISTGLHTINLSYETTYPLAKVGDDTHFRYTDRLPYVSKNQKITLKLPVGYIIPRELDKDESFYISPSPKEVYSDGQRVIILWGQSGQEMAISVIAREVVSKPTGWIILAALATLAALVSIGYTLMKEHKKKPEPKKKPKKKAKELLPQFIEDEKKVVDFLKKAPNNEAWQKTILKETGFSKAKVSRIIRNLEERGVVVKTIYGNTNKVTLKNANKKGE